MLNLKMFEMFYMYTQRGDCNFIMRDLLSIRWFLNESTRAASRFV